MPVGPSKTDRVTVERVLIKCGPLEKRMANHFNILAENPMNSTKKQKYMTLKNEPTRSVGTQCATREEWTNSSRKNEEAEMTMKT